MKRLLAAGLTLIAACTWSNSLYQARTLSQDAARAERDRQPAQARAIWGQVSVKAESAYARAPLGARGAEALWLAGHAAARTRDCNRAVPFLQGALTQAPRRGWEQQLLLELAGCEAMLGAPSAVSTYATLLAETRDPAIRREAHLAQGHVYVVRGEWALASEALAGEDSLPGRLDRATALAQLGRTGEALVELAPAIAAGDLSVRWITYLELFAVHNSAAADSLLDRVLAFPSLPPAQRTPLILATARAALSYDPDAADRRLRRITAASPGGVSEPQLLRAQLRLTGATNPSALRAPADSLARFDIGDAGIAGQNLSTSLRFAHAILAKNDSTAPGAPRGDLTMFALGELARDSLGASRLGAWFFARLEREWPGSVYRAKALLARMPLEPDSTAALLVRARALTGSPYIAAANGDPAGRAQVPRLEDSLSRYIARLWVFRPGSSVAPDRP